PDGKRLACEAIVQAPPTGPAIFVWDLDKPWPGDVKLDIWGQEWFWAPDGKGLVVVVYDLDGGEVRGYRQRLIDIATRQTTELAVPAGHRILDWSPDGTWYLTLSRPDPTKPRAGQYNRVDRATGTVRRLNGDMTPPFTLARSGRISPDGKKVVFL